jgi:FkbM family methyltransferase
MSFVPVLYALVVEKAMIRYIRKLPPVNWYGVEVQMDIRDVIHRKISGGHFEKTERRFIAKILGDGRVAIDIGAHCGFLTIAIANSMGIDGVVHSYEPIPQNAAELTRNVRTLGERVLVHQVAVVATSETSLLLGRPDLWKIEESLTSGNYSSCIRENAIEVKAININSVLDQHKTIDLVKIDIEGLETEIIQNITIQNLAKLSNIMFETVLGRGVPSNKLKDAIFELEQNGFYVFRPLPLVSSKSTVMGLSFSTVSWMVRLIAPVMRLFIGIDMTTVNFVAVQSSNSSYKLRLI